MRVAGRAVEQATFCSMKSRTWRALAVRAARRRLMTSFSRCRSASLAGSVSCGRAGG